MPLSSRNLLELLPQAPAHVCLHPARHAPSKATAPSCSAQLALPPLTLADYCFERPGGAEAQNSILPLPDEPGIKYFYGFLNNSSLQPQPTEISRERFVHAYDNHTEVVTLEACPATCSGHGYCRRWQEAPTWCTCFSGRLGETCG